MELRALRIGADVQHSVHRGNVELEGRLKLLVDKQRGALVPMSSPRSPHGETAIRRAFPGSPPPSRSVTAVILPSASS